VDTARFRFAQLDLNHHTDEIAQLIGDFRPEYVVNFSAQGMVAESWQKPEHWYETNIVGNVKLHDRLRRFDFLQRYVHISTPEVYGSCSGLVKEDAPFNPSTPYAASRAGCELHLRTFLRNYRFPVVFTRAANVYGPGQQLFRIIPRTILCVLLGKKLPLHGGGHSVRSFIHIGDAAEGTLRVARQGANGEAYHFSTTLMISIRDLVEKICTTMGAKFSEVAAITDDRPGKDSAYLLDATKARETLGWSDRLDLETGLRETIEWVRGNLEALKAQPQDYVHKP
jgi:dTDP-glucose 4,6-dehydratase